MGRQKVSIQTHEHSPIERENAQRVHLIVGMPANERMDWLIEKATELGVNRITPLMTQRSVLKLQGERATKKTQHWQLIAIGACEQSGRNSIPMIDEPITMNHLLDEPTIDAYQMVLSTQPQPIKGTAAIQADRLVQVLSGPEGGLDPREEDALIAKGFVPWSLGSRILRAETAALMGLMALTRPT